MVKRDGKRVPFQREKLARVIAIALRKRPVSTEQIDQIVSGIARKLESSGETEVASQDIGELAMESLRVVDPVGYVRYASVYRDFDAPIGFCGALSNSPSWTRTRPRMSRPQVTLKIATSMDGRIALSNGVSQWITNSESRARVHRKCAPIMMRSWSASARSWRMTRC